MSLVYVKKSDGSKQPFSMKKLKHSLGFTGARKDQVDDIIDFVTQNAYDGITTRNIYKLAFKQLRKISPPMAVYYGTKQALTELGPDGYLFEKFIAEIFNHMGYETKHSVVLEGKCTTHEIDVIAEKKNSKILIECKFHNSRDRNNDIKTALYIKARADDVKNNKHEFDSFYLISNTSFSSDAIEYSTCAGLFVWGANFPPQNTLQDIIMELGVMPLTCLKSLSKSNKQKLLNNHCLLAKNLKADDLRKIDLPENKIYKVLKELKQIHKPVIIKNDD